MLIESISLLPNLEPILGITFAVNLAYIALPRFRYRERIGEFAAEKLKEISNPTEAIKKLDWYRGVARLCKMPNHSNGFDTKEVALPDENWAGTYKWLFEKHVDRYTTITIAFFAAILMVLGTAHSFGYLGNFFGYVPLAALFSETTIHYWFWLTVVGMLIPVFAVYKGSSVVEKACFWANKTVQVGHATMQAVAQEVEAPTVEDTEAHKASK